MKHLRTVVVGFLVTGLFLSASASADHMAIVYCALDSKNDVRVMAADANITGGIPASVKKGQSCSQVLHEIMNVGYEVFPSDVPMSASGQIVFVLKKAHK